MSDEKQPASQDQKIFEDLLKDAPISPLNIEEPEFDSFDINAVIEQAKSDAARPKATRVFGKRTRKAKAPAQSDTAAAVHEEAQQPTAPVKSASYSQLREHEQRSLGKTPKTFRELLQADLKDENGNDPEEILEASLVVEPARAKSGKAADPTLVITGKKEEQPALEETEPEQQPVKVSREEVKAQEEEGIFDPSASLVDDYNYDEYEDHKRFLMSDYKKIEEYLGRQSEQGFHYTHHEGKKYYFVKARPHQYYYKVLYFSDEPSEEQIDAWAQEGWKHINKAPSRLKRDAGWYVFRNEMKEGELPKDIENEEEKFRYFTKFSASCRSTMFLLFIVMVLCALTIWLQVQFKGFKSVIVASAVLFVIALWIFLVYARMLTKSRKQASLLSARIRLADNDPEYQALRHASETEAQLEQDWDNVSKHEASEESQE